MAAAGINRRIVYFLVNHVLAGVGCFEVKRTLLNAIGHSLGEGTRLAGPVFCTGTLITGKDCWLGRNLTIHGNGQVRLGNNCDLAPEVTFLTGGHQMGSPERRAGQGETYCICIGDGCWLGTGTTLLGNITLGPGSVAAACACVTEDVPPNTLVGGVPAKIIKQLYEET